MMGSERRSMIISEKDKKITAWHEAGHALVARLVPQCDPVHKVTIIPRGPALGLTQMLPKEDRLNWNRQAVLDRIAMAMGGRIAEELQFNEITSGAKSLLVENKVALDRIAEALLEWETLDGADVEALFAGLPLKPRPAVAPKLPEAKRPEVKEKSKILDALGGLTAPVPKVETGKA